MRISTVTTCHCEQTWNEVVDEVGHGKERAGGIEEVHIKESHQRDPQAAAVEVAEAESCARL